MRKVCFGLAAGSFVAAAWSYFVHHPKLAIILLVLTLILLGLPFFLRLRTPFRGALSTAGLPSTNQVMKQKSIRDDDLLRFEQEILRLVNDARRSANASCLAMHGPLLADARARSKRISVRWRIFPELLRNRLQQRDRYASGLEVTSVRSKSKPEDIVGSWLRRKPYRDALLSGNYGLAATGVVCEAKGQRICVTILLAEIDL